VAARTVLVGSKSNGAFRPVSVLTKSYGRERRKELRGGVDERARGKRVRTHLHFADDRGVGRPRARRGLEVSRSGSGEGVVARTTDAGAGSRV
jgi:hypothetical protein